MMTRNKLFSYFGAKTKLLPTLYKRMPKNFREMINVEVFGGSGVWLFNKPKSYIEVFNDLDKGISAIFFSLVHHREELFDKLEFTLGSKNFYDWYDTFEPKTIVDRAIQAAFKIHFSFSGRAKGAMIRPSIYRQKGDSKHVLFERKTWEEWADRYRKVYVDNRDFGKILEHYNRDRTFFYLDPPYYISTETSGGYYNENFTEADHVRLRECLEGVRGKWLLSYDVHPKVFELYEGFNIEEVYLKYQARGTQKHYSKELLISNYNTHVDLTSFT